jgi:hypothetical protein
MVFISFVASATKVLCKAELTGSYTPVRKKKKSRTEQLAHAQHVLV